MKQITQREKNTLMAILPQYEEYVARRQGRSFIQYLGCHSMTLRWALSGKVYFVVMANFVPVRPWLNFDLKGATANRRALATRFLHELQRGHGRPSAREPALPSAASEAPRRAGCEAPPRRPVPLPRARRRSAVRAVVLDAARLGVDGHCDGGRRGRGG